MNTKFLEENNLTLVKGNMYELPYVTGEGIKSEALALMVKYPKYVNLAPTKGLILSYPYGGRKRLNVSTERVLSPKNREDELIAQYYELLKKDITK